MTAPAAEALDAGELFLQSPRGGGPRPLEMFVRLPAPNESHFYARGLTQADFAAVFSREIAPLDVLVTLVPPDLLHPGLWEPFSREGEHAAREKTGGVVVRTAGEQTLLWRSDRAEPGRVLREGIEAPARLLDGGVLRTTGEGLLALIRAWDGRGRFEWASLRGLPAGEIPEEVLGAIPADLARMKISIPEEFLFFVSKGEDARVLFSRREHLRCATAALLRGFVHNLSPAPTSRPGDHVCDQLARLSDARGLTARPGRDFTDKGRTLEVKARLGGTPWSPPPPPGRMSSPEDEEVLIYYDRTSGFWAVVH